MTARRAIFAGFLAGTAVALGWLLFVGLPKWYGPREQGAGSAVPSKPAIEAVRKITVRLFYVGADGTRLTSVEREVPFAERTVAQARYIVEAQLAPLAAVQPPADGAAAAISAIPAGTTLRSIFVTDSGMAFVDLSGEVTSAHPGGLVNELLTIYTIVQALTTNLPAVTSVQLLVDGKEVDTLAGHVDITRPLPRADEWVATASAPSTSLPTTPVAATGETSR